MKIIISLFHFCKNFLVKLALVSLILQQFIFVAKAQEAVAARLFDASTLPITPDGTTNTQVINAANGVPIVNIAAPNEGGLSHNKFSDFNIDVIGAALNNATGNQNGIVQTQIAGLINDNPNLAASGAASIILNEVTSNRISQINGYIEIAGKKADLIIANPNGISMAGAGFINVSKLTTIVGSADQFNANPQNLTFSLSQNNQINNGFLPALTISGSGIDLENVSSSELVASLMNIVAPIYAGDNDVALRSGDKTFNYFTKEINSDNTNPGSNLPNQIAIDASAFGKIQAGRIFIIATKEGFGIKYSADLIASRNGVNIDAQGNITYNNISATQGDIAIESHKGDIYGNGILQAKGISNDIKLTAFGNVTNNSQLLSARDINIKANSFTNLKNVAAIRNVKVNALAIDNTDSNAQILAGSLIDFDLGDADYEIFGKIISGGDVRIKANNITNKTNLQTNGSIEIDAKDKFTNGVLNQDNSNYKIISGNNLRITAKNLLSNYSVLSAKNNLTLTSTNSDINNNINAEIIGGTGTLTLSAKNGKVRQNSLHSLVSNGNLTLDVFDFDNTGRVDIAGDFILNVANNLTNEENALIYAGGNMELNVVKTLTNKAGAVIYSEGNLTIQKYALTSPSYNPANNRIASLINYGNIETYIGGNITIRAESFLNSRKFDPVSGLIGTNTNCTVITGGAIDCGASDEYLKAANHDLYSWASAGGYDWGEFGRTNYFTTRQGTINPSSKAAIISSGGTLTIETGTFKNYISEIYSKGDMVLSANNTDDFNKSFTYGQDVTLTAAYDALHQWPSWCGGSKPCYQNSYTFSNYSTYNSYIKSGGALSITRNGSTTSSFTNGSEMDDYATVGGGEGRDLNLVNAQNVDDLLNTGILNTNISNYLNGPDNQGLFTKNPNPNGPLFETRSEFLDQSKFFGSNYFYQQIGLNLTDVQTEFEQQNKRLIGDQFFQTRIIEEQLRTVAKNNFLLSSSEINVNNEIKNLLDNSVSEYARLGLGGSLNQALSQAQINSLQKDIIWFETKIIAGAAYVVPTIYLSQATRDAMRNGNLASQATIYAKDSVAITSNGGINNSGSIVSNNITLTAANDINNKNFSDITANNNLTITSTDGSINNYSQISANNNLSLTAAENINNNSTTITRTGGLAYSLDDVRNSGNPKSGNSSLDGTFKTTTSIYETASITGGSVTINAGNDFTNLAANISATKNDISVAQDGSQLSSGNLSITAGDDITISTLELKNRTETYWGSKSKGGSTITDTVTNVGSEISAEGSVALTTTGLGEDSELAARNAAALEAHNKAVAERDALIVQKAERDAAIAAGGKGAYHYSSLPEIVIPDPIPAFVASTTKLSDINITGSVIKADEDITIAANNEVNIYAAQDTSYSKTETNKKGSTSQRSSKDIVLDITNVSSNLNSGGDVNIFSGSDTNIIASNISGTNGNIIVGKYTDLDSSSPTFNQELINEDAKLTIKSGQDLHYKYHEEMKIKTDSTAVIVGAVAAVAVTVATGGTGLALVAAAAGGAATGAQGKKGKTEKVETTIINQIQSNLIFANNLNMQSASATTITASNLIAEDATILTGKFKDQNTGNETIVNDDAKLNINSAFDSTKTDTTTTRVKPNYVGIAVVSAASTYAAYEFSNAISPVPEVGFGPQIPSITFAGYAIPSALVIAGGLSYTGYSGNSNIDPNQRSLMDPLVNIRSKSSSSSYKELEIKTNLNFNNLITE